MLTPYFLFNLRVFDVPLMLFVSGLAFSNRKYHSIPKFLYHRAKRLLIPLYIFLTIYFILIYIIQNYLGFKFGITFNRAVESYMLHDGIGFVWIFRVFLLITLITPLLLKIEQILSNKYHYICLIILLLTFNELLIKSPISNNIIIRDYITYAIGYSIPFLLGLRLKNNTSSFTLYVFLFLSLIITYSVLSFHTGKIIYIAQYKYPPQLLYILYGCFMSAIIYIFVRKLNSKFNIIIFCGNNTNWIYLYHIPLIQVTSKFDMYFLVQYILVVIFSIAAVYIQTRIINLLKSKYPANTFFNYFKG